MTEAEDFPDNGAIGSKVVQQPFLHVFIPFDRNTEERVFVYNDTLRPEKDIRGLRSGIRINGDWNDRVDNVRSKKKMSEAYMKTVNKMYSFKIDSVRYDSELILSEVKKDLLGFETYLPLEGLRKGKHQFSIIRRRTVKDSVKARLDASIPFWYFPEGSAPKTSHDTVN